MVAQYREVLVSWMKRFDLAVMAAAFGLTAVATGQSDAPGFQEFWAMRIQVGNVLLFLVFALLWHGILSRFRLYMSRRLSSFGAVAADVALGVTVATGGIALLGLAFRVDFITPAFLLNFWGANIFVLLLSRAALRLILARFRVSGRNVRHVLVVGSNQRAVALGQALLARPELGYSLVGFVDERCVAKETPSPGIVTDFRGFRDFLREHVVDEVMVCVPVKSCYDHAAQIVKHAAEQGLTVRLLSDLFALPGARAVQEDHFAGDRLVTLNVGGMRGGALAAKRVIDVAVSGLLIVFTSPLLLAIAAAVRISSPGPVLFVQERMGLNKRRFPLYKFRTMVPDAEARIAELEALNEASGPVFKMHHDPRVFPLGRFLRKTSLDELPQLFNVLKGDMSLVGPRPLPVRDYLGFSQDWHRRRFSVKPGITCLWQVLGRHAIPFERWMELDMEYIDQWSLLLDLKILLKTIPAVVKGSGAS